MKGRCERPGEEKALKQKQKVAEEQDRPWKKQRSEDVLELGSVQPWGMPDWMKLFEGIIGGDGEGAEPAPSPSKPNP